MKTDHKFSPRNPKECTILAALENASEILCNNLNVSVTLRLERQASWAGVRAFHAGLWDSDRKLVRINMRNLGGASLERIIEILGHEFRHAVQTIHRVCDVIADDVYAPGINTRYNNRPYLNQPKEKDARKYQKAYATIVFNSKHFRYNEHLGTLMDGEPLRVPDYDASYARLNMPHELVQLFKDVDEQRYWFDLRDVNGKPKRWTKSVGKKVWLYQSEQLKKQPFDIVYRDVTIDDLVC